MKNMKMSKKLLLSFGIIIVYLVVMIGLAAVAVKTVSGQLGDFYSGPYQDVQDAEQLNLIINEIANDMLQAGLCSDEEQTAALIESAEGRIKEMKVILEEFSLTYTGDMADIEALELDRTGLISVVEAYRKIAKMNDFENTYLIYQKQILPRIENSIAITENIKLHQESIAEDLNSRSVSNTNMTIIVLVVIGTIALLTAIGLAFFITKLITGGLNEVESAAVEMSKGNFDVQINYYSKDELGSLAESMRTLQNRTKNVIYDIDMLLEDVSEGNLRAETSNEDYYAGIFNNILVSVKNLLVRLSETILRIETASDQVASGAEQVSGGAQALAQGATEQASSIEQLSATINIIAEIINGNAEYANDASDKTTVSSEALEAAVQKTDELVSSMNEISASSEKISEILMTIEDIAFQTNILALNAAVEAARAGEAGKGFAVVADEVRNLAGMSSEAAQTTAQLIEGTVQAINKGNGIVTQVAEKMTFAADSSKAVREINLKIADTAAQAADSVSQVATGVDQISCVVQNNSATAEQSAAAAEELSGQSSLLKELIDRFTLINE